MNKLAILAATGLVAVMGGYAIAQQTNESDFAKADANKDNTLSFEEAGGIYPTLTQQLFDQADANKDGVLDEAEYTSLIGLSAGLATSGNATSSSAESSSSSSSASSSSQQ